MQDKHLSPKAAKKYRVILDVALKIFSKEGFRNTDVQVIADLAGVGKGTIYRYFGNKEQLFLATSKYCQTQATEFIRAEVGTKDDAPELLERLGTLGILQAIAKSYARFYEQCPEAVEIMIQERAEFRESVFPSHLMHRDETRDELDEFIAEAIARGDLRDVDAKQITTGFADLLYGSVVNGCLEGGKSKLIERIDQAVDLFLFGIARRE